MEKPEFKQFGITQEKYDFIKSRKDKVQSMLFQTFVIIGVLAGIIGTLSLLVSVWSEEESKLSLLVRIFIMGIIFVGIGCAVGLMVGAITQGLYISFLKISSPMYRRVIEYESAKEKYESWWVRNQKEFWLMLGGKKFEVELAYLYSKLGYKVNLTPDKADQGIDIKLEKNDKKIIVQCKAHKNPVGPHIVRDLYGTLIHSKTDEAILASISGFTSGVREYVKEKPIKLISLDDIINMQKELDKKLEIHNETWKDRERENEMELKERLKEEKKREKEEEMEKEKERELDNVMVSQVEKEEKEVKEKLEPENGAARRDTEIEPYKILYDYREILRRPDIDQFQGGPPESMLPYSKHEIKDAIKSELLKETDIAGIEHLKNLYESLSKFIPDEEAKVMREWWDKIQLDFKEGMVDREKILVSEVDDQSYFLALDKEVQNIIIKIREEARLLKSEINKFIEEKEK